MVIYEDNSLLVVHKPAGIATQTSKLGQADLVSELKNYRNKKGESTYIGVVHRLDQPVEGLLVFAKTPNAAKKLSAQLNNGTLCKKYAAVVDISQAEQEVIDSKGGILTDYLLKDGRTNMSKVVSANTKEAKEAKLKWNIIEKFEDYMIVEIELFTGRHHQIRVQMSHANMPLLGDMKYGTSVSKELSQKMNIHNTALFANELNFAHPDNSKDMQFNIPLPHPWCAQQ